MLVRIIRKTEVPLDCGRQDEVHWELGDVSLREKDSDGVEQGSKHRRTIQAVEAERIDDSVNWIREFGQRLVQWRRLLASAAVALIAIGLCAHVLLGNNGWMTYRQKKVEYEKLQRELQHMDEENRRLDSEIKALKSDPKAIEKEAREQLRYAKPGEVIYLFPEQTTHQAQTPSPNESARR